MKYKAVLLFSVTVSCLVYGFSPPPQNVEAGTQEFVVVSFGGEVLAREKIAELERKVEEQKLWIGILTDQVNVRDKMLDQLMQELDCESDPIIPAKPNFLVVKAGGKM